ncbi:MAG: aminopeptidase P family protein [Pirellulales bacterium]|nr:aminopeptidase P family protein [Pirellulales bacterium]
MSRHAERCQRLLKNLRQSGADTLLVTNETNVTYLTGFTGDDSYLLVTPAGNVLISDPRYTTQLEEECPGLELHIRPPGELMLEGTVKVLKQAKVSRLGVEGGSMTIGLQEQLAAKLEKLEFVTTSSQVEALRMVKDKEEIAEIKIAITIAEKAFAVVKAALRPGQTEKQIADEIEHQVRMFGGKCTSFPPIVAVGDRAALPHYRAAGRKIADADFVLIDWGAFGRLYCSDLTRVLVTGKIPPKLQRIYEVTLAAQQRAIEAIRPGMTGEEIDAVARGVIEKAGFGKQFGHGLGHSLGLEIHEAPRFAKGHPIKMQPGMVMTVEPGIYLPGFGGVRIEDDILVTKHGCEVLTSVPKRWEDCVV